MRLGLDNIYPLRYLDNINPSTERKPMLATTPEMLVGGLYEAKEAIQIAMDNYPDEACGSAWLEQALELVGRSAGEIEAVMDNTVPTGARAE